MYVIFNALQKVIGYCDTTPNKEDLESRGEFFVHTEIPVYNPFDVIIGKYGTLLEPAPPKKTEEQINQELSQSVLNLREKKLRETDWIVTRHLEQKMLEIPQTLSVTDFTNILNYRQQLRDITLKPDFPNCHMPELLV